MRAERVFARRLELSPRLSGGKKEESEEVAEEEGNLDMLGRSLRCVELARSHHEMILIRWAQASDTRVSASTEVGSID